MAVERSLALFAGASSLAFCELVALRNNGDSLVAVDIDNVTLLVVGSIHYGIRRHRFNIFETEVKHQREEAEAIRTVFIQIIALVQRSVPGVCCRHGIGSESSPNPNI